MIEVYHEKEKQTKSVFGRKSTNLAIAGFGSREKRGRATVGFVRRGVGVMHIATVTRSTTDIFPMDCSCVTTAIRPHVSNLRIFSRGRQQITRLTETKRKGRAVGMGIAQKNSQPRR
jgi:hypothetical protein